MSKYYMLSDNYRPPEWYSWWRKKLWYWRKGREVRKYHRLLYRFIESKPKRIHFIGGDCLNENDKGADDEEV